VGPGYNYYKILNYSEPNFLKTTTINYSNPSQFLSLRSYFNINFIDNPTNPKTGIKFLNSAIYYSEINGDKDRFLNLSSSLSFYATPNVALPLTFALKLGAQTNIGNYKFYQANTLGNNTNLRGFRNQRYSGKSAYYANTELRFPVSTFRNYFLTGDFGVYTFYDIGRVQNSSNESNIWHQGYGPGIWLNLYNNLMVSVGYGISDESNLFSLNVGFNF
jgi:hemolysin activation/secretion protein